MKAEEHHHSKQNLNWKDDLDSLGRRIIHAEWKPEWAPIDFTESLHVKKLLETQVPTFLPNPDCYWGPGKKTKVVSAATEALDI